MKKAKEVRDFYERHADRARLLIDRPFMATIQLQQDYSDYLVTLSLANKLDGRHVWGGLHFYERPSNRLSCARQHDYKVVGKSVEHVLKLLQSRWPTWVKDVTAPFIL